MMQTTSLYGPDDRFSQKDTSKVGTDSSRPSGISIPDKDVINRSLQTCDTSGPYMSIVGLKKTYGLKPILRGIDLNVRQGERIAILGSNGTGKTTLLRILAGLTKPSAGTIAIEGFDIVHDAQAVRQRVGFVAHQPYLYEELTALENLLFFGRMYNVDSAQERAVMLLQRVGLEKRMRERINTFSRGQVQRLAWARALLHTPHLLLLDEPDTGLDQEGQTLIDALLQEHTERTGTTLFTTHQLERALHLGTQVVLLNKGRIVYQHETVSLALEELQHVYQQVGLP